MSAPQKSVKKLQMPPGYMPTPEQLGRIHSLKLMTGMKKASIRIRALSVGLTAIENDPTLLLKAAA